MTGDPFDALVPAAREWGVELSQGQVALLRRYAALVLESNARVNLTADEDPARLAFRHLADGLACIPAVRALAGPAPSVLDLGAGGGFIGIPVAVAWPEARVTLLEPRLKRFAFLSAALASLGLPGTRVLRRAPARGGGFDGVAARALAPLEEALAAAMPLARPGGGFVCYQSREPDPASGRLRRAMDRAGARWLGARAYRLPGEGRDRFLALFARGSDH